MEFKAMVDEHFFTEKIDISLAIGAQCAKVFNVKFLLSFFFSKK